MPETSDKPQCTVLNGELRERGYLIVHLDRWQLHLATESFAKHGKNHDIGFVRCGLYSGFYHGDTSPYIDGSRRNPVSAIFDFRLNPDPSVGGGSLSFLNYDELRPEVQEAIRATLQDGGLELRIN